MNAIGAHRFRTEQELDAWVEALIDQGRFEEIASLYYFAPNPDGLAAIYQAIAGDIRCGP
jgi:hypothetical protein